MLKNRMSRCHSNICQKIAILGSGFTYQIYQNLAPNYIIIIFPISGSSKFEIELALISCMVYIVTCRTVFYCISIHSLESSTSSECPAKSNDECHIHINSIFHSIP